MFQTLLRSMPLWLIGCLILAGCILASQLGRFIHRRFASEAVPMKTGTEGYIVGALFGLLAFMISATFSIAVDRYEAKRAWVAREASSISISYRRAGFLDEPGRSQVQLILRRYAHSRMPSKMSRTLQRAGTRPDKRATARSVGCDAERLLPLRTTAVAAYTIQAISDTLDIGAQREEAVRAFVPNRVIFTLILYLLVASAVLGFEIDVEPKKRRVSIYMLFALYTLALTLVLDLDSPFGGTITVGQMPLREVARTIRRKCSKLNPR